MDGLCEKLHEICGVIPNTKPPTNRWIEYLELTATVSYVVIDLICKLFVKSANCFPANFQRKE